MTACLLVRLMTWEASACSLFYIGGRYTDDGANMFFRVEDGDLNDQNKLYMVSPAGRHKAGEVYRSCHEFTWVFTHDSYRYVSRQDDNVGDVCPNCEGTHDHQPCAAAGANEHGFTMTATQSLDANMRIQEQDPYTEGGVHETEIATILLSECANARETVTLMKSIIEEYGMFFEGMGVMLCDPNEQWYAEAIASHYFLAVQLPRDTAFFEANVSVLGLLDLNDTEHIVATDGIIDLALRAGTFVGDAERNIIDYRRSVNDYLVEVPGGAVGQQIINWRENVAQRTALSLNFLEGTDRWNEDNVLEDNDFILTNIGEDGGVVPLHNNFKAGVTVSLDTALELMKQYPLGSSENVDSFLFRFYPDEEPELGVVQWSSMDNNMYNVFVPDYPVLLTDTWKGYQAGVPVTELASQDPEHWESIGLELPISKLETERPDTKDCYEMKGVYFASYDILDWTGLWHIHPEGWENSYSETFGVLSNYLTYMDPGEEAIALTKERFAAMQRDFEARFDELKDRLKDETDTAVRQEIVTQEASRMSEEAQKLALALYRHFVYGEELPEE